MDGNYNILNIVVNTEHFKLFYSVIKYYNILNIVVNTEHVKNADVNALIITY